MGARAALIAAALAAALPAWAGCHPFAGERLRFAVGWEFINAGWATMETTETAHGYKTTIFARTNRFFDLFKKVRDRIIGEGVCVRGRMQSTRFETQHNEPRYRAVKTAIFDWRHGKVLYGKNGRLKPFDVPAGHLNVLDAFYTVRARKLAPGDVVHVPVFDGGKRYDVQVRVLRYSHKYLPKALGGGRVRCVVIEPRLKTAGIFSSLGTIRIWLTDDARHLPVMLTAKIKIGRIVGRLVDYRPR